MMLQPQQQLNTAVVNDGRAGGAAVTLLSTADHQNLQRPPVISSSFVGANSLLNCCRFWSLSPSSQLNYHYQTNWIKPFASDSFRIVSLLLKFLIAFVFINLLLTSWIIVSLRLHQNTNPFRYGSEQKSSNIRRTPVTLAVDGSLTASRNLQAKHIEVSNGGIFGVASTEDQLLITTKKDAHNQSSFDDETQLPHSITLSGHAFEVKTTNLVVEENGKTTFQLTPTTLSFESANNGDQPLKAPIGGLRLTAKLDTSEVRSDARHEFHIESRTGALHLSSQQAIEVESMSSGDSPSTLVQSYDTLQLNVDGGSEADSSAHHLHFDSANIQMGHLRGGGQHYETQQHHQYHHHQSHLWRHQHHHQQTHQQKVSGEDAAAYQLCVCGSGHLFAAAVEGVCEADQTVCAS